MSGANRASKPMRYTRQAATNSQSYKSVTDNQPGRVFKDSNGGLHLVPDKSAHRIGKKSKNITQGKRLNLRDL